ncbi:MAG: sigma-70 family RNA polymerase sigma factor [Planctomycetota bacterium]
MIAVSVLIGSMVMACPDLDPAAKAETLQAIPSLSDLDLFTLMVEPIQRITHLLKRMAEGDTSAAGELLPMVYDDLRHRAARFMGQQPANHTLQPTALVHEAFLKLVDQQEANWESRGHFLCVAAKAMRSILADHARAKATGKRGGHIQRILLDDALAFYEEKGLDLIDLDEALRRLGEMDEQLLRIVELRFFGGLTVEEAAKVMGTSNSTVERGWRTARSWLYLQLAPGGKDAT